MIHLIIFIALIGLLVYLITTFIPMAQPFKILIYVLAGLAVLYLFMSATGFQDIPVPHIR